MKHIFFLLLSIAAFAQSPNPTGVRTSGLIPYPEKGGVAIGSNTPHASSSLDIQDNRRGTLINRGTEAQRLDIPSPAQGLLYYQTNNDSGLYAFNGSTWGKVGSGTTGDYIPLTGTESGSPVTGTVTFTDGTNDIILATDQIIKNNPGGSTTIEGTSFTQTHDDGTAAGISRSLIFGTGFSASHPSDGYYEMYNTGFYGRQIVLGSNYNVRIQGGEIRFYTLDDPDSRWNLRPSFDGVEINSHPPTTSGRLISENDSNQLISGDAGNTISVGTDGKMFSAGGGGGSVPDIDDVLTEGNTSDHDMVLSDGTFSSTYRPEGPTGWNVTDFYDLQPGSLVVQNSSFATTVGTSFIQAVEGGSSYSTSITWPTGLTQNSLWRFATDDALINDFASRQWVTENFSGGGGAVESVNGQTGEVVLTQDNIADGTVNKGFTAAEKTKLAGIAAGAQPGIVNSVVIAPANGFSGNSTGGENPTLTVETTVTGLIVGDGAKIQAAVSGTDVKTVGGQSILGSGNVTEVQNSMTASTTLSPSVTAVNTALANKEEKAGYLELASDYTGLTGTSAQKIFNVGANGNGRLLLEAKTYRFEGQIIVDGVTAPSGSMTFSLGGTATFTSSFSVNGKKAAETASAPLQSYTNNAVTVQITTSNSNTTGFFDVKGTIVVTGAGYLQPLITHSVGVTGGFTIKALSWFEVVPKHENGVTHSSNAD